LELLTESKRLPEVVVFMKCNEKNIFSRIFDDTDIRKEYERLMAERKQKKLEEKAAAR